MEKENLQKVFAEETIRYQEKYYRLAYSYTKNTEDALDIVQEAILKGMNSLHTLQNPKGMKTWFYRILVNTALDFLRKQKKVQVLDTEILDNLPGEADTYPDLDLRKALQELPLMYRSIVVLRYFEDLPLDEVAGILEVNINTVKTRLYTALRKLRLEMAE